MQTLVTYCLGQQDFEGKPQRRNVCDGFAHANCHCVGTALLSASRELYGHLMRPLTRWHQTKYGNRLSGSTKLNFFKKSKLFSFCCFITSRFLAALHNKKNIIIGDCSLHKRLNFNITKFRSKKSKFLILLTMLH